MGPTAIQTRRAAVSRWAARAGTVADQRARSEAGKEDGGEPEGERAEPQPVEVLTALEEVPERGEGREAHEP